MKLRLKLQITGQDYADAQSLHGRKVAFYYYAILSSFTVGMVMLFAATIPDARTRMYGIAGALVSWVIVIVLRQRGIAVRTRKLFSQQKSLMEPCDLEINDGDLIFNWAKGNAKMPWPKIQKWKSNERVILLYQSDMQFIPLPRRCFTSGEDFQSVTKFLKARVGPAGTSRKTS